MRKVNLRCTFLFVLGESYLHTHLYRCHKLLVGRISIRPPYIDTHLYRCHKPLVGRISIRPPYIDTHLYTYTGATNHLLVESPSDPLIHTYTGHKPLVRRISIRPHLHWYTLIHLYRCHKPLVGRISIRPPYIDTHLYTYTSATNHLFVESPSDPLILIHTYTGVTNHLLGESPFDPPYIDTHLYRCHKPQTTCWENPRTLTRMR